ncbi:hypothetical protein CK247_31170, partial [Klebsiella pneumoniae]
MRQVWTRRAGFALLPLAAAARADLLILTSGLSPAARCSMRQVWTRRAGFALLPLAAAARADLLILTSG